ncbi:LysR family transcriptional regulator [Nocardioides sp. AX2bis]|uniref:LysR family transcriptional regulator n=1 Tax=Nocardioides sp. AX2bis TaxID=2653157 RepID=UPI0012F45C59|nr:LysR family transcriptional regulator [Nocardioides sp. AX2bis]VXC07507.1 LysR family transcriptional regulator [Nocardioides sp. AX2bis]
MRIEQLEYLSAVTQHGSLRRASERLHVSQPALSEAVSKLERELGVDLLDRHRSGARISRRGRTLLTHMDEVLAAVGRLRAAAGEERTTTRPVRLGTVTAATSALLAPALSRLGTATPRTVVEMVTLTSDQVAEGVRDGSLDLGLVNLLDGDDAPADLEGRVLVEGRPVVVLPADHPLAARPEIEVDALRAEAFVMMRHGYLMHRVAHRLFGGTPPLVCHSTDGAELAKTLVADGVGLTLLPDYSVESDPLLRAGALVVRPVAGDRTRLGLTLLNRPGARAAAPARELATALEDGARAREARGGLSVAGSGG